MQDSRGNQLSTEKQIEDPPGAKQGQSTVTSIYQTKIAGFCRNVTVVWSKHLMNHSLYITVENPNSDQHHTCKIDLKPWHFWNKKGFKSFEVDENHIDIFWDFRSAKLSSGTEPSGDYYVAFVCDEEVVLLLGDCKKEAFKRTRSRPSLIDPMLVYKKENAYGRKCFSTRARFDERRKESEIVVEGSFSGGKEPEMWISIDGIVSVHVTNLQWKFRGHETVTVNRVPVQVYWDVHDWFFNSSGPSNGLFLFKPGLSECISGDDRDDGGGENDDNDNNNGSSQNFLTEGRAPVPDFCLFLYAWKVE
ncbi:hypothetical protein MRB53_023081 [Persea americana]|uniref:Uncharacterized protein n=1 Tax=Persea americana TaxID=3435 RepID=A0ACC2L9N6_PERAE|nr:hypothetical protein MRB53_023081 [Persea americana]